jgi:hypothetical protein
VSATYTQELGRDLSLSLDLFFLEEIWGAELGNNQWSAWENPIEKRREIRYISQERSHYSCDQRENKRGNIFDEYPCWIFPIHGICIMTTSNH